VRRIVVVALVCAVALLAAWMVQTALRWAPHRGPNHGPDGVAFRHAEYVDVEAIDDAPVHRLVLVGDAGAPEPDDPVLAMLGDWGDVHPERTTALFLGDNLYPEGLLAEDEESGEAVLLQLLRSTRADKILVPGNHDWGYTWRTPSRPSVLARQQDFVDAHAELGARFLPRDGCPGPVTVELVAPGTALRGGLSLVLLDLHWWLIDAARRPVCDGVPTTTAFVARLREELARRSGENVVVAAHHPIRSGGPHGGFTRGFWRDLGIALFYRFYAVQDVVEPGYREMVGVVSGVLAESPPLAMVGGHDHSLQVIDGGDQAGLVVVSGAATKVSAVTHLPGTLFAHARRGFVVFDLHGASSRDGESLLVRVVELGSEEPAASFVFELAP
jgi:hypothetical protein